MIIDNVNGQWVSKWVEKWVSWVWQRTLAQSRLYLGNDQNQAHEEGKT